VLQRFTEPLRLRAPRSTALWVLNLACVLPQLLDTAYTGWVAVNAAGTVGGRCWAADHGGVVRVVIPLGDGSCR